MIKKSIITAAILGLIFFAGTLSAQTTPDKPTPAPRGQFVDVNKDGVCDNLALAKGQAQGRQFVDQNGDGICDRFNGQKGKRNGQGQAAGLGRKAGRGQGQCQGTGKGFRHGATTTTNQNPQ